jgi:hypothetical protein
VGARVAGGGAAAVAGAGAAVGGAAVAGAAVAGAAVAGAAVAGATVGGVGATVGVTTTAGATLSGAVTVGASVGRIIHFTAKVVAPAKSGTSSQIHIGRPFAGAAAVEGPGTGAAISGSSASAIAPKSISGGA